MTLQDFCIVLVCEALWHSYLKLPVKHAQLCLKLSVFLHRLLQRRSPRPMCQQRMGAAQSLSRTCPGLLTRTPLQNSLALVERWPMFALVRSADQLSAHLCGQQRLSDDTADIMWGNNASHDMCKMCSSSHCLQAWTVRLRSPGGLPTFSLKVWRGRQQPLQRAAASSTAATYSLTLLRKGHRAAPHLVVGVETKEVSMLCTCSSAPALGSFQGCHGANGGLG